MATPLAAYNRAVPLGPTGGRLWRALPQGRQAVMIQHDGAGLRPTLSRGRYRHVIAVVVPPDAVGVDIAVVRRVFGPRVLAESDVASQYEIVLCG